MKLNDNLGAVDVRLWPEDVERLDSAKALAPEYPGWMIERQAVHWRGGLTGERPRS